VIKRSSFARLERLEQARGSAAEQRKPGSRVNFDIDPDLARSIRDDHYRAFKLRWTAADEQEREQLRERNAERVRTITVPEGYTREQQNEDSYRLHTLWTRRITPPGDGAIPLSAAEDAEEAQLRARMVAVEEAERSAERRIRELEEKVDGAGCNSAEEEELNRLRTAFPMFRRVDITQDPCYSAILAYDRVLAEYKAEDERRLAERARLRAERNNKNDSKS
jgi:hypothetical protein